MALCSLAVSVVDNWDRDEDKACGVNILELIQATNPG